MRELIAMMLFLIAACTPSTGHAQDTPVPPTISTERPSVGLGPDLVPPHFVIAESGVAWSNGGGQHVYDGTESLLRVGVSSRTELRLQMPNILKSSTSSDIQRGDGAISAKVGLFNYKRWPVSAVVNLSLPVGSAGVSSGGWDPAVLFSTSHALNSKVSAVSSANMAWVSSHESSRKLQTQLAFDAVWSASRTVTPYIEYAPLLTPDAATSSHTLDSGLGWTIYRTVQIDARIGAVVTQSGVTTIVGFGYSVLRRR